MKARRVEGLDPAAPLAANARPIVATRLAELRDLAGEALEPGARSAQHEMRIAAKRLRYVLELLGGCLGPAGERGAEVARELQTVLGEIHDCDVMAHRVEGIDSIEGLLRTRRELLYRRFVELWTSRETLSALTGLGKAL